MATMEGLWKEDPTQRQEVWVQVPGNQQLAEGLWAKICPSPSLSAEPQNGKSTTNQTFAKHLPHARHGSKHFTGMN